LHDSGLSMADLAGLGISVRQNGRIEQRIPCPQCGKGPRDDALGVNIEDGRFHCFRCGWKGCAGAEVAALRPATRINDPGLAERKRQRLRMVWSEAVPLYDPKAHAVRSYLNSR
jgi:hypothetical protein